LKKFEIGLRENNLKQSIYAMSTQRDAQIIGHKDIKMPNL